MPSLFLLNTHTTFRDIDERVSKLVREYTKLEKKNMLKYKRQCKMYVLAKAGQSSCWLQPQNLTVNGGCTHKDQNICSIEATTKVNLLYWLTYNHFHYEFIGSNTHFQVLIRFSQGWHQHVPMVFEGLHTPPSGQPFHCTFVTSQENRFAGHLIKGNKVSVVPKIIWKTDD